MIVTKRKINSLILFFFLMICIFFPGDPYHIKLVLLFALIVLNCKVIVKKIGCSQYRPVLLGGMLFPIVIMLQSFALTGNLGASISGGYSPTILLLLIPIVEDDLNYKKQVLFLLKSMAISVLLIATADLVGLYDVNGHDFIRNAFYDYGMGVMGKSPAYSSYYRIFYKASPLLVLLLDDSISKQDYKWVAISFGALWFTGTRANVFSASIIFFFRYVVWSNNKKPARYLIAFLIVFAVSISFPRVYNMIVGMMNTSGAKSSDSVRSGEVLAYAEVFSDPVKLLFGSGFGEPFFNYGRGSIEYTSELSYFEMIRCVGLIFAIPFFAFVFRPILSKKVNRDYSLSYICYLLIAATNPLLFSSTAFLIYMFMYYDIVKSPNSGKLPFGENVDSQKNVVPKERSY